VVGFHVNEISVISFINPIFAVVNINNKFMLGLISAMYEEMDRVLSQLENVESQVIGQRTFYRGTFQNQELVLVFSRWGKVAAATTVTQLINTFKVDQIVFSGVAGSIHPQVKVGDIVLANALVQHDMNASPLFPPTEIPLLEKSVFHPHFEANLENAIHHFAHQYAEYFNKETLENFGISKPQLHHGKIASGDLFVHSKSQIDGILLHHPDTLCVENGRRSRSTGMLRIRDSIPNYQNYFRRSQCQCACGFSFICKRSCRKNILWRF
jgi:adenosylhomocysteine nucleosidase